MKVHPFKLTISLYLSIFLVGLYFPALASPSERGAPLAVEPFSALAFEEGAPADFEQSAAAGNNARLAGNPAAAERIYTKAFMQVVSSGALAEIWLPSSNLLSLYSDKTALYNPELAVIYGKLALNSLTSMAEGASLSLPSLFEQPQGLFETQSAQIYHQLGTELLQLQRYDEAEKVMQFYKQRELQELLGKQVSTEAVQGIGLTSKEAESLTQLGLPSTESDSMKSWVGQSIRTLTRLVNSTEKAQVVSTPSLAESDPKAVTLHYFVTEQQVSILLRSAQGSYARTSPYSKKELDRHIRDLRVALTNRLETKGSATTLWRVLIAPVQDLLTEIQPKTLVLNLSGRLRYLPFAALQDLQGRFLIEDFALINATAAVARDLSPSNPISRIDALGLSQARLGQSALPGVKEEIQAIVKSLSSPQGLLKGTFALDEKFTSARFANALRGENNVLHVATHFKFRAGNAKQSLLYMGQGEPLNLIQLSELDYSKLDLLTLSACETAVGGGIDEHGMEVEGLAASVLKAGARSVMGSLWSVSDQSTGLLMKEFYRQRSTGISSNAQALRQAQLWLSKSKKNAFSHPFFWSAFTVSEG